MSPDALPDRETRSDLILGSSPAFLNVCRIVERIAPTRATVLITGESGTGKDLVARDIHARSTPEYPFLALNCAAIPHGLLEAELFGYERGAYTDAKMSRKGLFELASGGSLFLDEIGLMPLELQAKLLSVVETGTYRRLGSSREFTSRARILAATNEDIEAAVREGRFRQDLFYRLNVIRLPLPPLRDRGDDALLIADTFLNDFANRHGRPTPTLSDAARQWILRHTWPGNVRELRNVIERAVLLASGSVIGLGDLTLGLGEITADGSDSATVQITAAGDVQIDLPIWGIALEDVVRKLIESALHSSRGNLTEAARLLHVTRDTLRYRIQKYRIDPSSFR